MIELSLSEICIYSIPEALVLASIAFAFAGERIGWGKLLGVGIITGATMGLIRPYLGNIMVHLLCYYGMLGVVIYLNKVTGIMEAIASSFLTGMVQLMVEYTSLKVWEIVFNKGFDVIFSNETLILFSFSIQIMLLIMLSVFLHKKRIAIFSREEKNEDIK